MYKDVSLSIVAKTASYFSFFITQYDTVILEIFQLDFKEKVNFQLEMVFLHDLHARGIMSCMVCQKKFTDLVMCCKNKQTIFFN